MSSITILALDLGSNCGYCVMQVPQPIPPGIRAHRESSGLWNLEQKRFEGYGMRFVRMRKLMSEIMPDFVMYEQVNFPHKSSDAARLYGALVGCVSTFCEENGIAYGGISTSDLKKRAVNKGGGPGTKKPDIVRAANTYFQIDPELSDSESSTNHDHDIADAMWLMQVALEQFAGSIKKREQRKAE